MEWRHHPLEVALEGRPHQWAVPWEVRHHLPQVSAKKRHLHPWAAATRCRVYHRQRSSTLISGLVVTATSRSRSRTSSINIRILFIWSNWILLFFSCKMLVFSLRSSDSLIRSDWKLKTWLSSCVHTVFKKSREQTFRIQRIYTEGVHTHHHFY
jgi:hypothetical protein